MRPNSASDWHTIRRWVLNVLRAAHVVGLIGSGSMLFGGNPGPMFPFLLLGSGLAMAGLDLWSNPAYFKQAVGLWMLIKLALVTWLALDAVRAPWLFWLILIMSVLAAHAPAKFRHRVFWHAP